MVACILRQCNKNILLSPEILKSFSSRLYTAMERLRVQQATSLKRYLFSSDTTFLQESSYDTATKLANLITFYDLPINILNLVDLGGQLNYFRMLVEFKKVGLDTHTIQCIFKVLQSE